MEVTTKFNIGSKVFLLVNNCVVNSHVSSITVHIIRADNTKITPPLINIKYSVENVNLDVEERRLYSSKDELLKSL